MTQRITVTRYMTDLPFLQRERPMRERTKGFYKANICPWVPKGDRNQDGM